MIFYIFDLTSTSLIPSLIFNESRIILSLWIVLKFYWSFVKRNYLWLEKSNNLTLYFFNNFISFSFPYRYVSQFWQTFNLR